MAQVKRALGDRKMESTSAAQGSVKRALPERKLERPKARGKAKRALGRKPSR